MSRWGSSARSSTSGSPAMSWPMAMGKPPFAAQSANARDSTISLRPTILGVGDGTSRPTKASPGIVGWILIEGVLRARARSFCRATMLWTLTLVPPPPSPSGPSLSSVSQPGSRPKRISRGPAWVSATVTFTPWLARVCSMRRAVASRASSLDSAGSGIDSRATDGSNQGGSMAGSVSAGWVYKANSSLTNTSITEDSLVASGWTSGLPTGAASGLAGSRSTVGDTAGVSGEASDTLGSWGLFVRDLNRSVKELIPRLIWGFSATNRTPWPTPSKPLA